MMRKSSLVIILLIITVTIIGAIPLFAANYNEAPILRAKVERGELPSVEERLPENPLVLKPLNEIGKYGGTWRRLTTWEQWYGLRMSMYGHSYVRWIDDGLDIAPNLLTDWQPNEDKTVWTLYFRKGIRWSDGAPFTTDDVLYWYEDLALNEECSIPIPNWAIVGDEPMEVEKVDDYIVKFKFSKPQVVLMELLATWPDGGGDWIPYTSAPKHYLSQFHPKYSDKYTDFIVHEEKQEWWYNPKCPVLTAWMPVRHEPGELLELERNPYYYAVDPQGNQLPYIDRIRVECLQDGEVLKMKVVQGNSDFQIRPGFGLRDISILKQNEEKYGFETLLYDSGSGGGDCFMLNHNNPDSVKESLYRNPSFSRALSHAIDRGKIKMMVYYGQGEATTGTMSPKGAWFHTEKGKIIYQQWKNLAVEYNPEKAKQLLDEIGVVDQDGDGWRDKPNGEPLELRVDINSALRPGSGRLDTCEITKVCWENIGIKTKINPTENANLNNMLKEGTFDIQVYTVNDGDPLLYPAGVIPIGHEHFAPLYGTWNRLKGTGLLSTELDKKPRDRTPPREKPAPDSPYTRLYDLYKKALITADDEKRAELVYDIFQIHIDEGPFFIGTVNNTPRVGVVSNRMKNVPRREDLALGGFVDPWIMSYSAILNPPTFYIEE